MTHKLALCFLLMPIAALAQWDGISINGTYLRLGMQQSEVLARLGETSTLKRYPGAVGGGFWCVQPKNHVGLPWDCASVVFSEEKLVSVTKELGTATNTEMASLLNQLYLVVSQAEKSGVPVQIRAQPEVENNQTQQRERSISFFIGRKDYEITIVQPIGVAGPSFTTLYESLVPDAMLEGSKTSPPAR